MVKSSSKGCLRAALVFFMTVGFGPPLGLVIVGVRKQFSCNMFEPQEKSRLSEEVLRPSFQDVWAQQAQSLKIQ